MGEITFSGLASGMDTSSWINALVSIKQQSVTSIQNSKTSVEKSSSVLSTVKSKVSNLRSSIEKLTDAKFGGSFDLFSKNVVSSSKTGVVTATVTADAVRQNLDVVVKKLATSTKATSNLGASGLISEDTKFSSLASGNAKEGTFSVFVDGNKTEIELTEDTTLGDVLTKLNDIDGVNASIENGKLSVTADDGKKLVIGSASDESNFTSVMGLVRNSETGNYESTSKISRISTSDKLVDAFEGVTTGTLKIGNAEFTIDENTTIKSFIANVNKNEDAGVTAYWDASKGEMVLKSKTEGAFNINIEAGTSNLTDILGFTSNGKLADQELGDYAELTVNGSTLVSSSNTVTSDISGIEGVTLTLKSVSKPDDDGTIEPATISVEQDTSSLLDALKSFVSAYNETISNIDDNTSYGDALYGDSALTSLRTNLRRTATASLDSGTLKLLSDIGISTGKANNSTSTSGVNKLEIDEDKFKEALAKNPEAVKELLVGDNKGNSNSGGVMNKLEKIVEDSLETSTGYFDNKAKSLSNQIKNLETSITNAQSKVDAYKTRLQKQFNNMEQIISSIQASYSKLSV